MGSTVGDQTEKSGSATNLSDSRIIIYQNNAMEWKCLENNFTLTFQSGSLPAGTIESKINISVSTGEDLDLELPVESVPVSSFFSVKCQHKFNKKVSICIEHFSAETADLSFVASSSLHPPFQFESIHGGVFNTRHGQIKRSEFSIFAIITKIRTGRWPRMLYYCALYTNPPVDYTWTVHIYITKNSATYRHRIEEETRDSERLLNTSTVAVVDHTVDYFVLDISLNDEEISHGWQLPSPNINPIKIQRMRIDRCGTVPVPANFKIILDVSKINNPCKLFHSYRIADVEQENILSLSLSPQVLPGKYEVLINS